MNRQYTVSILAVAVLVTVAAVPVHAEDPNPLLEISRTELADLLAKSAELEATKKQVTALEGVVAAQARQIEAQARVITLMEEEITRRERITGLADEERDIHKGRADRIEKNTAKGNLWLRVQARAGSGALLGVAVAPIFPPAIVIGPLLGALGGLIEHWLVD